MTNTTNNSSHLRRTSVSLLTLVGVLYGLPASALDQAALPQGGTIANGSATITYNSNTPKLDINQASHGAVIDWNSFNIGEHATTEFHQPDANAIAVNRVHDGSPSQILGSLKANGNVVVLNQNGVMFGQNATVDVGGLVASTGTLNEAKFNQTGAVELSNLQTGGKIQNDGTITVADRGLAAFVAPEVVNNGVITAKLGRIELAAGGERATVDLYGDKLVELALDETSTKAIATNAGTLQADGGMVAMTAAAVEGVVNNIVNAGGIIQANSVDTRGGRIVLTGNNVNVAATGQISAKGAGKADGGTIKVKSNKSIWVSKQAKLDASAGTVGHGGTVDIIADKTAKITGTVKARGGSIQGDGGTIDTSGHERVDITGTIDAGATNGKSGTWATDPRDLIIQENETYDVNGDGSSETPYASEDNGFLNFLFGPSYLDATTVRNALDKNTALYITTVGTPGPIILDALEVPGFPFPGFPFPGFPFFQNGDITINANLNVTGGNEASLNLNAAGSIFFGTQNKTGISSTAGLNLAFIAGNDIYINRDMLVQGTVGLTAGGDVHVNGTIRTGGSNATVAGNQVLIGDDFTLPSGPFVPYVLAFDPIIIPSATPGLIDAEGGDIIITNADRFYSADADTLRTTGIGKITANQYDTGSLQNAVDAFANTGTGLNQLNAKAGVYNQQVNLTQANFRLQGDDRLPDGTYTTFINAPFDGDTITEGGVSTEAVISAVDTDHVTIDGLAVAAPAFSFADRTYGVYLLRSEGSVVSNNLLDAGSEVVIGGGELGRSSLVLSGSTTTAGIALEDSKNALIQYNTVNGADTGILLTGASTNAQIDTNTVDGQTLGTTGISSDATSTNVSVTNNTVSNVTSTGIYAAKGAVTVSGNTVTNTQDGIQVFNSDVVLISLNTVDDPADTGISVNGSDDALLFMNTVNRAGNNGILLDNSQDAYLLLNEVNGSETGIALTNNTGGAILESNTVDGQSDEEAAGAIGIFADSTTTNATIINNTVRNLLDTGILIDAGLSLLDGNTATNMPIGIDVSNSGAVKVSTNTLTQISGTAISVDSSTGASITGNIISESTGAGIVVSNADSTTVSTNTVDVGGDAITSTGMTGVTLDNNTVTAAAYGISVIDSNATVSNNKISGTTKAGIYTGGAENGTITLLGNTIVSLNDGAHFASGLINFAATNSFSSQNDGLVFDPLLNGNEGVGTLAVAGNTFGTTVLTDQAGYYIRLANGALFGPGLPGSPIVYNASQVNFNGTVYGTNTLSTADSAAIESRLFDYDDANTLGQIFATAAVQPPVEPPVEPPVIPPVVPPVIPPAGPGTPLAALAVDPTTILPDQAIARSSLNRAGSVTITGLPFAPGAIPASVLANLDSAAGGDGAGGSGSGVGLSATQLNDLDSAAGGDSASCWGDVYSHFGQSANTAVTFSLDTAPQSLFNAQTRCAAEASGI